MGAAPAYKEREGEKEKKRGGGVWSGPLTMWMRHPREVANVGWTRGDGIGNGVITRLAGSAATITNRGLVVW